MHSTLQVNADVACFEFIESGYPALRSKDRFAPSGVGVVASHGDHSEQACGMIEADGYRLQTISSHVIHRSTKNRLGCSGDQSGSSLPQVESWDRISKLPS